MFAGVTGCDAGVAFDDESQRAAILGAKLDLLQHHQRRGLDVCQQTAHRAGRRLRSGAGGSVEDDREGGDDLTSLPEIGVYPRSSLIRSVSAGTICL